MHAMMTPEQILEHAQAAEAAGRAPLLHGHAGPGALEARLPEHPRGRAAGRRAHQPEALRLDRPHVGRARQAAQGSRHPARAPQRRDGRVATTPRSRRPSATRAGCARSTRSRRPGSRPASAASSTSASRASSASRWRSSWRSIDPTSVPINLLNPRPGTKFGDRDYMDPVGGGQVDRDLPADPARGAVPALRRPRREPRRAAAAGRQGRAQRRDDGQLPDHARLRARGRPRDVRGARPERRRASPTTAPTRAPTTAPGWLDGETPARRRSTSWSTARTRRTSGIPATPAAPPPQDLGAAPPRRRAEPFPEVVASRAGGGLT